MGKIKKICFITTGYPVPGDMVNTFVDALICEMSRQGVEATVIAPFNLLRFIKKGKRVKRPRSFIKKVDGGNDIHIYCPPYLGAVGNKYLTRISQKIYNGIILREFRKLRKKTDFDAVYGHFFNGGIPAQFIGKKYGIPSFVACGESSLHLTIKYDKKGLVKDCVKGISGIICVSTKNKNEIYDLIIKGTDIDIDDKIDVFPNAFNPGEFYITDKETAETELGLPKSDFRVCFTGRFIEHKGIAELCEALKKCDDVNSIFIGSGPIKPDCDGVDYCGTVDHEKIVKYLGASDVFVLPTKAEGCCNAIVEALGCGKPVISSDLPFNYDILDETNSILVNQESPQAIADAIMKLKNDTELKEKLHFGAVKTAKTLTLPQRAEKILTFMEERINREKE